MRETDDQTGQLLARARSGDGDAFAELTGPFQRELQVHCYRILGSAADAEADCCGLRRGLNEARDGGKGQPINGGQHS